MVKANFTMKEDSPAETLIYHSFPSGSFDIYSENMQNAYYPMQGAENYLIPLISDIPEYSLERAQQLLKRLLQHARETPDGDFTGDFVLSGTDSRDINVVRLGKLMIVCSGGGKGSFSSRFYYFNELENNGFTLEPLFFIADQRWGILDSEEVVPFPFGSGTIVGPSNVDNQYVPKPESGPKLSEFINALARGETVKFNELKQAYSQFVKRFEDIPQNARPQFSRFAAPEEEYDYDPSTSQVDEAVIKRNENHLLYIMNMQKAKTSIEKDNIDEFDEALQELVSLLDENTEEYIFLKKQIDSVYIDMLSNRDIVSALHHYAYNSDIEDKVKVKLGLAMEGLIAVVDKKNEQQDKTSLLFKSPEQKALATIALLRHDYNNDQTQMNLARIIRHIEGKQEREEYITEGYKLIPYDELINILVGLVPETAPENDSEFLRKKTFKELYEFCQQQPLQDELKRSSLGTSNLVTIESRFTPDTDNDIFEQALDNILQQASAVVLRTAVLEAIDNYLSFSNSMKNNPFNRNPESKRADLGFFSGFRHGKDGRKTAKDLRKFIVQANDISSINDKLAEFFTEKNRRYHKHSLSSYLMDKIKDLESSPWADITTNERNQSYNSVEIIEKAEQYQAQKTEQSGSRP